MFSQTVLAADPGLDTVTSSFLMTVPLDQLVVKVVQHNANLGFGSAM